MGISGAARPDSRRSLKVVETIVGIVGITVPLKFVMITQEGLKTDLVPVIDYSILFLLSQRLEDESRYY